MIKIIKFIGGFFRRRHNNSNHFQFIRLLWISLKRSLLHFWINIQPSLRVLKDDLLRTAKLFGGIFQLFLKEIIKKGVTNLIEVLKRFVKNERVLNRITLYLSLSLSFVLIFLALVLINKIRNRK
jgi:hypothetical protein